MSLTPDQVRKLLDGTATDEDKKRAVDAPDEASLQAIEAGWKVPAGPDVFDAAFDAAHPRQARWWRQWVPVGALVAAAATVAVVVVPTVRGARVDTEKGVSTAAP